jgi:hypothetical protein
MRSPIRAAAIQAVIAEKGVLALAGHQVHTEAVDARVDRNILAFDHIQLKRCRISV